jgi:peptide/nickel transport system ATP-binding protein
MRQRIMIAMALLSNPSLLVADEPTSALDVTLEAQIIDLIRGLREELGTAMLYITHDLGVVAQLCDRVLVMYAGTVVEAGEVDDIFVQPKHPYTRALLQSHPSRSAREERLRTIPGRVPSLRELPAGCKFSSRCEYVEAVCHQQEPAYLAVEGQEVRCHAYVPGWQGDLPSAGELHAPLGGEERRQVVDSVPGNEVVIETRALQTHFSDHIAFLGQILGRQESVVRALDGVDLVVRRGETLALVGESGSGKTTFGRTILRLEQPTAGAIVLEGRDITSLPQEEIRPMRARMQMIFQDPAASLSPRMKVSSLLLEPFRIHGVEVDAEQKVNELLEMVGLSTEQADKYPHQLSGGQARRVGIARALALNPDILVADEPTAGLDVSVAAGILNLLKDLRERLHLTYVIITHNLNEIGFIADRVAVMYLGKVVELAPTARLFSHPQHPYSEALMSAISIPDPTLRGQRERVVLQGEIPSPRHPPPGCPFHPRCRYAEAKCSLEVPSLAPVDEQDRFSACFFPTRVRSVLRSTKREAK